MLKRLFKLKRYFFIVYAHEKGVGHLLLSTNNGIYPSIKFIHEHLIAKNTNSPIVTNIIELSKKDFIDLEDPILT